MQITDNRDFHPNYQQNSFDNIISDENNKELQWNLFQIFTNGSIAITMIITITRNLVYFSKKL